MQKSVPLTIVLAAMTAASTIFCSSAQAQWGTLKGRIVLDGDAPNEPPLIAKGDPTAKDAAVCAAQSIPRETLVVDTSAVDPKERGIANIFIYRQKKPDLIHPDLVHSTVKELDFDQKGCRFTPHAMFVRTDQKVRVMSGDDVAHNTHSYSQKNIAENFIVPPQDRKGVLMKAFTQSEKLPFGVKCDIHAWMEAYWLVLDHPYAAVTDEKGNYEIANLPVGDHEFIIWHESCGYLEKKYAVKIKDGDNEQKLLKYTAARILPKK